MAGKGFQEKIDNLIHSIQTEVDHHSNSSSLLLTITLELIEEKKHSKWTFWANEGLAKEKWNITLVLEKQGIRSVDEIRNDMRSLIIDMAKECLKYCDHLSEGFPTNFTASYKLSRN